MDSPIGTSPRKRRFGRPGVGAAAAGPLTWLQKHPGAAAALYMLIGGCIVYVLLGGSSSSGSSSQQQQQHQHQQDGIVRLATVHPDQSTTAAAATPAPATFKAAQAAAGDVLCSNTCFKARDGVCDDGRYLHNMTRELPSTVLCDLGTDCEDCGPWKGVQHSDSWQEAVGPIEFLRQHNLTVLTKRSAFEPRFHLAFTDPQHDIDASKDFAGFSTLEQKLSHIAYHVLHGPCQQGVAIDGSTGSTSSTGASGSTEADHQQQQQQQQLSAAEGLVLDVGAGFGWYSLLAGMLGCRVIAWEPVKIFQAYMEYGIARNRLQHKVEVRAAALVAPAGFHNSSRSSALQQLLHQPSQQQQQQVAVQGQQRKLFGRQGPQEQQQQQQPAESHVTVVAPTRGLWGTASIGGRSIYLELSGEGAFHKYTVPAETLDAVVLPLLGGQHKQQQQQQWRQRRQHSRVVLLKVDIEGHEPEALAGAAQLLGANLVDNVLLEYAPHVAETHNVSQTYQYPHMLMQLAQAGFSLGHVADMNYLVRPLHTYSEPLHQLQAITEANLKFDLLDCMQMTEVGYTWLHEPCREMLSYGLISEGIPERMHPKSFRSTFETHTHVWATRQPRYTPYVKGPAVGVFPSARKLSESWFVEETSVLDRAMGGRSCKNLRQVAETDKMSDSAKASFLIGHRCRCTAPGESSSCAEQEKLADACAMTGRTPFREEPDYVPNR